MITNAQIKKIKTLQRAGKIDDDTYRDILRNIAGVNSAKELRSKRQIDAVILHLSNLAEKIEKKANQRSVEWKWEDLEEGKLLLEKAGKVSTRAERPSFQQLTYIFGLWWALRHEWKTTDDSKMEPTLNHFLANRRAGDDVTIANWQWLTYSMAQQLINVLKARIADQK